MSDVLTGRKPRGRTKHRARDVDPTVDVSLNPVRSPVAELGSFDPSVHRNVSASSDMKLSGSSRPYLKNHCGRSRASAPFETSLHEERKHVQAAEVLPYCG